MKLVTFQGQDRFDRVGALSADNDAVIDLSEHFPSMLALIDGGHEAIEKARNAAADGKVRIPRAELNLRAPIPVPRQIRDAMLFEKHLLQATRQAANMKFGALGKLLVRMRLVKIPKIWYQQPVYYKANRFSVIGPDADVIWPGYAHLMDFELELAIVIGRTGKDIAPAQAMDYVFGYTIFNDMSARCAQMEEMGGRLGPAKGKDFDTGNVFGPCLVTRDEIPDPCNLSMIARVNGEVRGQGNSGSMYHRFQDLIAHVSRSETIYPGEILGSGTVGDGCGLEHGRFLSPGDVVELEIERIGVLRNRLVNPNVAKVGGLQSQGDRR
jgi:2-keto-4-pentenoate hydratase/2-oxohepta-3-ene-1,7-dioic acid hydratase in catechol pathway